MTELLGWQASVAWRRLAGAGPSSRESKLVVADLAFASGHVDLPLAFVSNVAAVWRALRRDAFASPRSLDSY